MSDAPKLSARQADVLEYIAGYLQAHKRPPTIREIAEGLAYRSTSTAHTIFKVLVRKGFIEHVSPGESRAYVLVSPVGAPAPTAQQKREALCIELELWTVSLSARAGDDNDKLASLLARVLEYLRSHADDPAPPR